MNTQKFIRWLSTQFNKVILVILALFPFFADAQVNRYVVFFKDKSGSTFSTSAPLDFLSQKAIDRRQKYGIEVTESDLPVDQNYVQGLRNLGIGTFFKSRWLNAVLVQCDVSAIPDIQSLAYVQSVEFVAPGEKLLSGARQASTEETFEVSSATATQQQLHLIGIDSMHCRHFHGEGITIAVMDSGFPNVNTSEFFQDLMSDGRVEASSYDFVFNTTDVFRYDQHGAKVLSVIAAYQDNVFTGSAYKANFQLYVTEDVSSEFKIEEYNWLFAAERADSAGADIISTSLGYNLFDDPSMDYQKSQLDGKTAVITKAAQWAADRGILVIASAGNEGANSWGTITPPADAEDVLAIANVNVMGERSATSSFGPTADNRIKPDLAALGTGVSVITSGGAISSTSGTSFAAPLITGLAAGLWQAYPELSNKDIVSILKKTASQSSSPDSYLGWGIPNFIAASNYISFQAQEDAFIVYPNPFNDLIILQPKNPDEIPSCMVEILSTQGQTVLDKKMISFNWLSPNLQSDLSFLSPGLYFLRAFFDKKIFVFKIIKR